MKTLLCQARASAKAIGAYVAGFVVLEAARRGFSLGPEVEAGVGAAVVAAVVWFTRNDKCEEA